MSSHAQFNYRMRNALLAGSPADARDAYNDWQASNCYYPQKVLVCDSHTQISRFICVPCGRCYHCIETKINSWVTRMYSHLEDFKHVYFITLTYRSITSLNDVNSLLLGKLSSALWHYDALNTNRHPSYNPCVLVKSHYQLFLKRLRKLCNDNTITYVLSGEYGKQYGRPHFHLVLFSSEPISREQVVRAWSIALHRSDSGVWSYKTSQKNGTTYYFPIGRVDYNDLVTNGTLNTTARIRVDGNYLSASRCFAYVCKYVCKSDKANYSRVSLAYNSLFEKRLYYKVFGNEIDLNNIHAYLTSLGYPVNNIITITSNLLSYEKIIKNPKASLYSLGLPDSRKIVSGSVSFSSDFYPSVFTDFRDVFAPFVEFSRGVPIGSFYTSRHISEFAQGVFNKPLLQDKGFVVPSYWRKKTQDYLYRHREMHKSLTSTSYVLGGLVDRLRFLSSVAEVPDSFSGSVPSWKTSQDYTSLVRDSKYGSLDAYTGEHILLMCSRAMYFKYDRSKREYVRTRQIPISDYIRSSLLELQAELERFRYRVSKIDDNQRLYVDSLARLSSLGLDSNDLRDYFVLRQEEYLHTKQSDYDCVHAPVE